MFQSSPLTWTVPHSRPPRPPTAALVVPRRPPARHPHFTGTSRPPPSFAARSHGRGRAVPSRCGSVRMENAPPEREGEGGSVDGDADDEEEDDESVAPEEVEAVIEEKEEVVTEEDTGKSDEKNPGMMGRALRRIRGSVGSGDSEKGNMSPVYDVSEDAVSENAVYDVLEEIANAMNGTDDGVTMELEEEKKEGRWMPSWNKLKGKEEKEQKEKEEASVNLITEPGDVPVTSSLPKKSLTRRILSPTGRRGKIKYLSLLAFLFLAVPLPRRWDGGPTNAPFPTPPLPPTTTARSPPRWQPPAASHAATEDPVDRRAVPPSLSSQESSQMPPSPRGSSFATRRRAGLSVADAVRKVGPSVVRIDTETAPSPSRQPIDPFDELFGPPGGRRGSVERGQGSGVIFDKGGLILTNAHVVEGADTVHVTLTDGRRFLATVRGTDELTDLAVLQVATQEQWGGGQGDTDVMDNALRWNPQEGPALPVASLGNSEDLQVGDWVIAVGNPVGLDNTVTMGIVSSLKRSAEEVGIRGKKVSFIQTDAAINPGNSGGPLVNDEGEVIGVNTCIRANAEGIGFAIPINKAKSILPVLASGRRPNHGFVGILMTTLTPDAARQHNADPNTPVLLPEVHGAMVGGVLPRTPAADGGLRIFDVVTSIGGTTVKDANDAKVLFDESPVGEALEVKVIRGRDSDEMMMRIVPEDTVERQRELGRKAEQEQQQREQPQFHEEGQQGEGGVPGEGQIFILPFPFVPEEEGGGARRFAFP